MANSRADHYRRQAEDCRLQAENSKLDGDKASWLKLAAQWQRMAEEADPASSQQAQQPQAKAKPAPHTG